MAPPWLARILPNLERICAAQATRTVFTRFVPARVPGRLAAHLRALGQHDPRHPRPRDDRAGPELARFVPPARVLDKSVYSPWIGPELERLLAQDGIDTLVVTGGESDVCVLATILGAVDRGYRVIVACDGVCSSADPTYDAQMFLYHSRFGTQIETAPTGEILEAWPAA